VERVSSQGLRTGPMRTVCDPPEKHRSSQAALPAIIAPAASIRVTMVASRVGTKPCTVFDPFIIGTPATMVLSLIATLRPARGPSPPSVICVVTYQALNGLSAAAGRDHSRCGCGFGIQLLDDVPGRQQPVHQRGERGNVGLGQRQPVTLGDSSEGSRIGRLHRHGGHSSQIGGVPITVTIGTPPHHRCRWVLRSLRRPGTPATRY